MKHTTSAAFEYRADGIENRAIAYEYPRWRPRNRAGIIENRAAAVEHRAGGSEHVADTSADRVAEGWCRVQNGRRGSRPTAPFIPPDRLDVTFIHPTCVPG
ncbi:hypothetical protein [Nocardia lijiangensis]|uniref:hypothetical protein n=1 Tax=Nocardia lijiangensis TaxID=299618 RepID=UPI003D72DD1E